MTSVPRSCPGARGLTAALIALAAGCPAGVLAQDSQPAEPPAAQPAPAPIPTEPESRVAPPDADAPDPAVPAVAEAPADGEPQISFSAFAEPITIAALIEFIADQLGVIIMQTDAGPLASATVEFNAPIDLPRSRLLPLLETLLAPRGFTLTRSPEGLYSIAPAAQTPVDFSEGAFSPTRIIRTPLLTPSSLKEPIDTTIGTTGAKILYVNELGLIISTAPSRVNDAIEALVERMTREFASQTLHRIDLAHIAATEAKVRVLELFGQASQQTPAAGQAVQGAATPAATSAGTLGNLQDRLLIDRPSNALIFRGSAEEADQVRRFVGIVDQPSRLIVRRYFAGPTAAEICQVGSRQGLGPIVQSGGGAGGAARAGGSEGLGAGFVLAGGDAESFTYYGTEPQHEQVSALVSEFADQAREETFIVEFYKLESVAAEDAADLLTELLDITQEQVADSPFLPGSQQPTIRRGTTEGGGSTLFQENLGQTPPPAGAGQPPADGAPAEGETSLTPAEGVSVIADVQNNQLIIRAPRRQQREFARIIERIDQRRPQVYIEAQIISVNRSKDFTLTVDTALTSPNSDVPIFTNFGLVPFGEVLPIPNSTQGATAAVFRDNYTPIVVNALMTVGDARLLSSPKILVLDNEEASVSGTTEEPFAAVSQGTATATTSQGGTASAGTTLTVRPTIGLGNAIRLEYTVELSSFGERPSPELQPTVQENSFTSIANVPAGSTIVLGGISSTQRDNTISKVPLLGDIPIIGNAFKAQGRRTSDRTVYVFLTPRVLRDETFQDLRLLSRGPRESSKIDGVTPDLEPAVIPVIEHADGSAT